MPVENYYLAKAPRHMLAEKAGAILRAEVSKGCVPDIAPHPVALEPFYQPVQGAAPLAKANPAQPWVLELPPHEEELVRLQVWISPDQRVDWVGSESFLKELACLRHRIAMEIIGNEKAIEFRILCHRDDHTSLHAAFRGQFEQCELAVANDDRLRTIPLETWERIALHDFLPPPPYSHLFTTPGTEAFAVPYPDHCTCRPP